jgi:hypothetical protein
MHINYANICKFVSGAAFIRTELHLYVCTLMHNLAKLPCLWVVFPASSRSRGDLDYQLLSSAIEHFLPRVLQWAPWDLVEPLK